MKNKFIASIAILFVAMFSVGCEAPDLTEDSSLGRLGSRNFVPAWNNLDSTTLKPLSASITTINLAEICDENNTNCSDVSAGLGGGIANVVEDLTPELGGNLDGGGFVITNIDEVTIGAGDIPLYVSIGNSLITSVITEGILTINGGDGTKFDISDGNGVVIDQYTDPANPAFTAVTWSSEMSWPLSLQKVRP